MAAILVDTNVLAYAHDRVEHTKQGQAIQTLYRLQVTASGRLSTQCLAEFFSVTTRGSALTLSISEAARQVGEFARGWTVFDVTPQVVLEAVRGVCDYQFSFWDAQIWAVARLNQVPVIFSEDFNSGVVIEGVRFVNPFAEDFQPEAWGL